MAQIFIRSLTNSFFLLYLALITLVLNIALPKAGFYLGGIPITLGYVFLGMSSVLMLLNFKDLYSQKNKFQNWQIFLLAIFAVFCLFSFIYIKYETNLSTVLPYFVSILLVPCLAIFFGINLWNSDQEKAKKTIFISLSVIVIFGLVHFILLNFFKINVGIPFITSTGRDLDFVLLKNNYRHDAGLYKMMSTYNNGNILGVCMLMFLPFLIQKRNFLLLNGLRLIVLLTLSRGVWIVWIFIETLYPLANYGIKRGWFFALRNFALTSGCCVLLSFLAFKSPTKFLFDSTLGNRIEQLDLRERKFDDFQMNAELKVKYFGGISEIVYTSMLKNFGIIGLLLFLATWFYPFFIALYKKKPIWIALGLLSYLVIMASDGAFMLIPTQFIYWLLASLAIYTPKTKEYSDDHTQNQELVR